MSLLRKIGKIIFGTLFSLSLAFLIILFILSKITAYNYMSSKISSVLLKNYLNESVANQSYNYLSVYCSYQPNASLNVPIEGYNITLKCSEIRNIKQKDFVNFLMGKVLHKIYYRNLKCENTIPCLKNPMNLFSKWFNNLVRKLLIYVEAATVGLGVVYLALVEKWHGRAAALSSTLLSNAIPYFVLVYYLKSSTWKYASMLLYFLRDFQNLFVYLAIIGGVFAVAWLLLKKKNI